MKLKTIYGVDKMTYILYKMEGIDYDTKISNRNTVLFTVEDSEELNKTCLEWDRILNNTSDETVNIGRYIYIRNLIAETIKNIKRR